MPFLMMYEPEDFGPMQCNLSGPVPGFRHDGFWIAELSPPLRMKAMGTSHTRVLLYERTSGSSIANLGAEAFPVYILAIKNEQAVANHRIGEQDAEIIGWAMLGKTMQSLKRLRPAKQ
jgi:hypothetical protein